MRREARLDILHLAAPCHNVPVTFTLDRRMCTLYRLGSVAHDPEALWLSYEWESFDNHEWRQCVEVFLTEVAARGYEVTPVSVPGYEPGEDFVGLEYSISGSRTTFASDHLLSLITISSENPQLLRGMWEGVGNRLGWAD